MILIHNKSFEELSVATTSKLQEIGFDITPGSIAKLFSDVICKNTSDFYDKLTESHLLAFLTTSSGEFLDSIGLLLDCERLSDESDADYKKRISYQTMYLTKANETAIRLAVLMIEGVEDVKMKRYSHGPGSFTIVPLSSNYTSDSLLKTVEEVALKECSCGERAIVKSPDFKFVKLDISLVIDPNVDDTVKQELAVNVRDNIQDYISSIKIGETFIINRLTEVIMGTSSKIINYACNNFIINNEQCMLLNQSTRWDEKFVVSPDEDAIVVK